MKKTQKRFIFRKGISLYEIHEMKKEIVMNEHTYILFKNPYYFKKWWVCDKDTGIYVTRGETIDEAYEKLYEIQEKLKETLKTNDYLKLAWEYSEIVKDWKANGERFTEIHNQYSLDE